MRPYEHTQIGYVIIYSIIAVGIFVGLLINVVPAEEELSPGQIVWILSSILFLVIFFFYRLKVVVDQNRIKIIFGIGFVHHSWQLKDIVTTEIITCPWWYGWGIHFTPHGTLFNVSGSRAVALRLSSGRTALIGSDEPEKLQEAIMTNKGKSV